MKTALRYQHPSPHLLVTVDPGKRLCGVSLWWVRPHAQTANLILARNVSGARPSDFATALCVLLTPYREETILWVLEKPKNYDTHRAPHHDLESLRQVLEVVRVVAKRQGEVVAEYYPHAWKGNVPKKTHHNRMLKALGHQAALKIDANLTHDTLDAVALGLFALGVLDRGGKTPTKKRRK